MKLPRIMLSETKVNLKRMHTAITPILYSWKDKIVVIEIWENIIVEKCLLSVHKSLGSILNTAIIRAAAAAVVAVVVVVVVVVVIVVVIVLVVVVVEVAN